MFQILLWCLLILHVIAVNIGIIPYAPMTKKIKVAQSPHWDNASQSLYVVDGNGQNIFKIGESYTTVAHLNCGSIQTVVSVNSAKDQLMVVCNFVILLVTWNGTTNVHNPPFKKLSTLDDYHENDTVSIGKCDPSGRFLIGTRPLNIAQNQKLYNNSLYSFDGLNVKNVLNPLKYSAGLAWDYSTNTMFYSDFLERKIYTFKYNLTTGQISDKYELYNFQWDNIIGNPGGIAIDNEGFVWIAVYGTDSIICVHHKSGVLTWILKLSDLSITDIVFGGFDGSFLFITSLTSATSPVAVYGVRLLYVNGYPSNGFVFQTIKAP